MKNLPKRIFLNLRHTWQVKKGNKCLPDDFVQLRDDCGECITHTLGAPNHEDDPEYILNDKSEFVPEEWGRSVIHGHYVLGNGFCLKTDEGYCICDFPKRIKGYVICRQIWNGEEQKTFIVYGPGPLTTTLYRLIAEANGIPIPEGK